MHINLLVQEIHTGPDTGEVKILVLHLFTVKYRQEGTVHFNFNGNFCANSKLQ